MVRILAALLGLMILAVKGYSYYQVYLKGVGDAHGDQILNQANLLLIRYFVGVLTSLLLVGLGSTLLMFAIGPAELREKAANFLSRAFSDSGLIAIVLLLLLFVTIFR